MIDISLIGTGGMMPLHNRFLTAMAARIRGRLLLIDCGEGTQVTLKQLGWGLKNLDYICFTHFHADHISGLPGLLLAVGNASRTAPMTIIGPKGIENVVRRLCVIAPELPFELRFIELTLADTIPAVMAYEGCTISALPLDHTLPCVGYCIQLGRAGKFDAERALQQNIPRGLWTKLQKEIAVEHEGKRYTPDMVMGRRRKGLKIAYITDTRPTAAIPEFIRGSDLFICEGLYGDEAMQPKAQAHKHMVFSEAATLAKLGEVEELWLTHYSPAMQNPEDFIQIAKDIFGHSKAGYDRMTTQLIFCS